MAWRICLKGPSQSLCWFFSSVIYRFGCIYTSAAIYHGWAGILEFGSGQQALVGRIVGLESPSGKILS